MAVSFEQCKVLLKTESLFEIFAISLFKIFLSRAPVRCRRSLAPRHRYHHDNSLIGLSLAHYLLRGEADVAGRKGVSDEEVVLEVGIIVLTFFHVWPFDIR